MAGLPYISWRQSADRLKKTQIVHPYSLEFEKFRIVERSLIPIPRNADSAKETLRISLLRKKAPDTATRFLRNEWYFLKCAVESAYFKGEERRALPFRIYAEYRRRTQSRTPADQVLQEEEAL